MFLRFSLPNLLSAASHSNLIQAPLGGFSSRIKKAQYRALLNSEKAGLSFSAAINESTCFAQHFGVSQKHSALCCLAFEPNPSSAWRVLIPHKKAQYRALLNSEKAGFEPAVKLPPHKRSRFAP